MRLHPASWGISVLCCTLAGCGLFSRVSLIERTETCQIKVTAAADLEPNDRRRWVVNEDCVLEVEPEDVDGNG